MGGRKAHELRDANRHLTIRKYHSVGYFNVTIDRKAGNESHREPIKAKLIEADVNLTGGSKGLPAYSDSPNAVYVIIDEKSKTIERVRIYDSECVGIWDFEGHEYHGEFIIHEHKLDFDSTPPYIHVKNTASDKKRKGGHEDDHRPVTQEHYEMYKELIDLLGKFPNEIPSFVKRV